MSLVLIFLLPVEKTAAPTLPAAEESTEPRPETSTADPAESAPEAEATCSEPAEDTAAEDACPDPGGVTAEPPPEAGPPADAALEQGEAPEQKAAPEQEDAPEQEEAPEPEVPNEDTTNDSGTNAESAPGDNRAADTVNKAAPVAELGAASAAAQSAVGEDSAQVQMCSKGNNEVLPALQYLVPLMFWLKNLCTCLLCLFIEICA